MRTRLSPVVAIACLACAPFACADRRGRTSAAASSSLAGTTTEAATSTSVGSTPSASPSASEGTPKRRTIARATGSLGVAFAPADVPDVPPTLVYLHGSGSNAEESCPYFELAAELGFVLVCPHGDLRDATPGARGPAWSGTISGKRTAIDRALDLAATLTPSGTLARTGGILIGFSSGASCAVEIALAEPGRHRGLVLMSMPLSLSAVALKKAGVARVVLGAAENDGSYGALRATAKALEAAGLPTRFESFGRVGHHFAADMPTRMRDDVAWLRAAEASPP
jgi:predicted esterase